jgi:hypothetical protein
MNYQIIIKRIDTVNEVEGYWSDEDYIQLLKRRNEKRNKDTDNFL